MTTYKAKTGHDVALLLLVDITPQPQTIGLQYTQRDYAADGTVHQQGPFVELNFSMIDDATEYQALLTQFGLTSATTASVTVYIQNENYTWARYNGTIVKPMIGNQGARDRFFLRNFTFVVKNLEASA